MVATQNIVFIDSRVAGYQTLIAQLGADTEWHLLDAGQDGVEQMQHLLTGRTGLDSIQVVSHGSVETLYLGSTVLNSGKLGSYQSQLQAIGSSLTATGDILLYGCNVAQGDAGIAFINSLARYTGADVAASTDATGPARLGGDADLEQANGSIEAAPLALVGLQQTLAAGAGPSFASGGGKVTTDFGGNDYGFSVIQQADGKLVVAGSTHSSSDSWYNSDLALARYNTDGTLDTNFSGDGKLTIDFGSLGYPHSVIQQADGKLVVAGATDDSDNDSDFALARYHADGRRDTSFSDDSKVTTDFGSNEFASSIFQQTDGKLVVAGYSYENYEDEYFVFALDRYNANGTLDTSFSGDGKLTTDFGSSAVAVAHSVIQQADGKLVVAGESGGDFVLVRYNTNGTLDTSFSGDGKLAIDFGSYEYDGSYEVIQQADGKLVVAGDSDSNFAVARYNANGTPDTSFSGDGKLTTDFGSYDAGFSVIQQTDGKLVVAGDSDSDFALVRYNTNGTLDTSFDGDGKLTTDFGSYEFVYSVIQQADGKLVVAGSSDGDFALARYNLDGSLDSATNHAPTGSVTVTGTAKQGQKLTASNNLADTDGLGAISYQWKANGQAVSGATKSTYQLTQAQVGKVITVTASYTDSQGTAESKTSASTAKVANVNDAATGTVTISGTTIQGQILKASNTLADVDGLGKIGYQWKTDGKAISGATGSTYKLTPAEVGKAISVTASYTDLQGTAENKTSSTTKEVLNGVITGTSGNNTLMGTHAADKLSGLAGNDVYYVNHAGDTISDSRGGGTDVAYSYLSSYTLAANVENGRIMVATAANLTGNALNNVIYAGTGNNTLDGGAGTDTVSYQYGVVSGATSGINASLATGKVSGSGTDKLVNIENLTGSSLNDTLAGNASTNVLTGGLGADSLYGGADKVKDVFDFNAITESKTGSTARDKVYDFVGKIDQIDLSGIDASTVKTGNQAFAFSGSTAKANSVWYKLADVDGNATTKDLIVYGDTSGDAKADFEIGLVGLTAIAAADFAL